MMSNSGSSEKPSMMDKFIKTFQNKYHLSSIKDRSKSTSEMKPSENWNHLNFVSNI